VGQEVPLNHGARARDCSRQLITGNHPLQVAIAADLRGKRLDDSVLAQVLDPLEPVFWNQRLSGWFSPGL